jgi:uncharacterized FlaG/YvyC family protein
MREIKFSLDNIRRRVVIRVIDQMTKEVIREISSDELFDLVEADGILKEADVEAMADKTL